MVKRLDNIWEVLLLESTGVMYKVKECEKDNNGYTNVEDLDVVLFFSLNIWVLIINVNSEYESVNVSNT